MPTGEPLISTGLYTLAALWAAWRAIVGADPSLAVCAFLLALCSRYESGVSARNRAHYRWRFPGERVPWWL